MAALRNLRKWRRSGDAAEVRQSGGGDGEGRVKGNRIEGVEGERADGETMKYDRGENRLHSTYCIEHLRIDCSVNSPLFHCNLPIPIVHPPAGDKEDSEGFHHRRQHTQSCHRYEETPECL